MKFVRARRSTSHQAAIAFRNTRNRKVIAVQIGSLTFIVGRYK